MARCGSTHTEDGRPCRSLVRPGEGHCWRHGGSRAPSGGSRQTARSRTPPPRSRGPAAQGPDWEAVTWHSPAPVPVHRQVPPPLPPSRGAQERERIKQAADFCADTLSGGWREAVADRATEYTQTAWERLSRSRRKRNCKKLARMARAILQAKDQIHKLAGELAGDAASVAGVRGAALEFTEELVANIPLPIDAKMVAVARGIQVAGILMCVMDNRDLTKCECFIDLAKAEAKERVQQILVAAMSNWTNLARFSAKTSLSALYVDAWQDQHGSRQPHRQSAWFAARRTMG